MHLLVRLQKTTAWACMIVFTYVILYFRQRTNVTLNLKYQRDKTENTDNVNLNRVGMEPIA